MDRDAYIDGIPGTEELVDIDNSLFAKHKQNSQIVLIPPPTQCGADPLTWPYWKKYYQLLLLSVYACAFSFGENTLGASWTEVAEDIRVSLTNMNGGSALNYLLLGFGNVFWIPAAMKIGRRPIFLGTILFVIGSAVWTSHLTGVAQYMLSNVLNGVGTSAYEAVIQLSVMDMFYVHERGRMFTVYIFGQQLGSVIGLVSGGKIADAVGWRWSQYIVAIANGIVFLFFFFSFEETLFPRFLFKQSAADTGDSQHSNTLENPKKSEKNESSVQVQSYLSSEADIYPKRNYGQKLKLITRFPQDRTTYWQYFRRPFFLFQFPNLIFSGFLFAFACTAGIVTFNTISEILTDDPYDFSTTATGLICLGAFVGNIIGWCTGCFSDYVVIYLAKKNGGIKEPEMRLWVLCFSFFYGGVGYLLYGWGAQNGSNWFAICAGLCLMIAQQVTCQSVATAYGADSFRGVTGELVTVLAIFSSLINFAISYSVQPFIDAAGYGWSFTFWVILVLLSHLAAIPTYRWGKSWRKKYANKYYRFVAEGKVNEEVEEVGII